MPNGPAFKEYLLPHLKRMGVTQEAFAAHFGYSKAAVTGWFKTGKVGKHTVKSMAELLGVPREEIEAVIEDGDLPHLESAAPLSGERKSSTVMADGVHPLVSKLASAIEAGQLSVDVLNMLEAAIDSQITKARKTSTSKPAVPPPSVLIELRTAQLDADAGTATPKSIGDMNRRIRSRNSAERDSAEPPVVGDDKRRNKKNSR